MTFKGTLGTGGTVTALPNSHTRGDTYRVITAGTYAGVGCEVGDLVMCITSSTSASNSHWTVAQTNIDGAVTHTSTSVDNAIARFDGTTGKVIQNSGVTINDSGVLVAKANQYNDAYDGALNMNNSDIYGLNSIYTGDSADGAGEGIHFYRDATHVDTLWMNGGDILFVPNRALGTNTSKANSQKVGRFTTNPTTGQMIITDGTTGGMKSSGYTFPAASATDSGKFLQAGSTSGALSWVALNGTITNTPSASQTLTSLSQVNGNLNATFGAISITKSQISDFPTSMTPSSHTHGNIKNDGTMESTGLALASGDYLIFSDASNSGKIERTNITFDGSTTTQALTKKGTWETFSKLTIGTSGTTAAAGDHAHGSITNSGAVSTTVTIANGDRILITDSSDSSKVKGGIAFGTSTTSFLANDGT